MKQGLFFAFCILSIFSSAQNFDIDLLNKINSPPSQPADNNWKFITNTATPISIATPLTMFATGLIRKDNDLKIKSYKAGASILLSTILTTGIKFIVQRERPYDSYPELIYKKSSGGSYSFPSGHTSIAFAAATSLSLSFPRWYVIIPSYAWAGAVGYSRMYLGVHYPSDVIGGIITGIGISLLSYKADRWINNKK